MRRPHIISAAAAAGLILLLAVFGLLRLPGRDPAAGRVPSGPSLEEAAAAAAPVLDTLRRDPAAAPPPAPDRRAQQAAVHLRTGSFRLDPATAAVRHAHSRPTARGVPWMVQCAGPVRPEWRRALEEAGARLRAYLPDNAFLAEIPAAALDRVRALPFVTGSGEYRPAYKIHPLMAALARTRPDLPVPITLQTFAPDDVPALEESLAARGASDIRAASGRRWGLLRAVLPARTATELASIPEVQWIEPYEPPRILNDEARIPGHLNVDAVREDHGLDGTGQIVAIADTGLDTGDTNTLHPDLAGRLIQVFDIGRLTNWSDTYYHGTHVAGSVLGTGAASGGQYRGMAPGAGLVFQSVMTASSTLALPDDLNDLYRPTYDAGARIHSDSWGSAVAGDYTSDSMTTDEFIWDHPDMLIAFSAGNAGTDADRDGVVDFYSLNAPASAKNVMAVGAAESERPPGGGGLTARTYGSAWYYDFPEDPLLSDYISSSPDGNPQGMAAFSSRGPALDGRSKPDLVAPGTDIISLRSRASSDTGWGLVSENTNYCFMGGTSMSTPLAVGAAALVRQYCTDVLEMPAPSAALLKATLAGGSRSLFPGQYGTGAFLEIPDAPRPNHVEGWGQIDVAGTLYPTGGIDAVLMDGSAALYTGASNVTRFLVSSQAPLTVVLAYSDYPSSLSAAFNLVNDLDLLLIAPDGTPVHPNGGTEPDRVNNLEGIDIAAPATGVWTAVVSGWNVPQGPQPYALYWRGALQMPVDISHEPLVNTIVTNADHTVAAALTCAGVFDPDSVRLVWSASSSTGGFTSTSMSTTNGIDFEAALPAAPVGTRYWYYLAAGPDALPARHPAGAPLDLHTFEVAPALTLDVSGWPSDLFSADPAYGSHQLASNLELRAQAFFSPQGTNGLRTACVGWTGTGSVPAAGIMEFVDFTLDRPSSVTWLWQDQAALTQLSSPYGALTTATWHELGGTASSLIAPERHEFNNVDLSFAGWLVDGSRFPAAPAPSRRQIDGIPMPAPRTATATYLATALDSDANGLPDWFEMRYYGQLGQDRYGDADEDGFEDELEAADHTDPLDSASQPSAPGIQHTPLAAVQDRPAPWTIDAVITDNYQVAAATLHWQRNGGIWRSAAMSNSGGSSFTVQLPSPARDGDTVAYRLSAADPAGFSAQSVTWTVTVSYARLSVTPASLSASLPAGASTNLNLTVWNLGSQPLEVSLSTAPMGFIDDMESGTNGWTRPDGQTAWHLSTQEAHSPSNAWYCGNEITRTYANSTHAALVTPPIQLGDSPRLDFMHWAQLEFDTDAYPDGVHYWDSGILEITANDGLTWNDLVPEGGYPGLITSNPASPFEPDTPCFADTDGWEPVGADLGDYAGREVRIRFRFGADAYVVNEGWRLDDVVVSPLTEQENWLTLPPTNTIVPAGLGAVFPFGLDTAALPPMGSGHLAILVHHNDPEQDSPLVIPASLFNTTRRVRVTTDGNGQAAPLGEILVQESEPFSLDLQAGADAFIADLRTNGTPLALTAVLTQMELSWMQLNGNLDIHAVFAPLLEEGSVSTNWLASYGLTTRCWMAEASLDQDGDGLLTWQEEDLGSSPVDPAEAPLVIFIHRPEAPATNWVVSWHAFTNLDATYTLQSTPSPADGFTALTNLPAAPPVMTSPPLPPSHRFFGLHMQ